MFNEKGYAKKLNVIWILCKSLPRSLFLDTVMWWQSDCGCDCMTAMEYSPYVNIVNLPHYHAVEVDVIVVWLGTFLLDCSHKVLYHLVCVRSTSAPIQKELTIQYGMNKKSCHKFFVITCIKNGFGLKIYGADKIFVLFCVIVLLQDGVSLGRISCVKSFGNSGQRLQTRETITLNLWVGWVVWIGLTRIVFII